MSAAKRMKPRMVQVLWEDAAGLSGWRSIERHSASGTMLCSTVGYLVKKDKRSIVVVLTLEQEDNEMASDSCTIPAGWVRSIKRLVLG